MKLTKDFRGVKDGEVIITEFKKGDECPKELEAAAIESGSLEIKEDKPQKAKK